MLPAKTVAYETTKALDEKKGVGIKLLKIDKVSSLADYFIICTGTSGTHVKTLNVAYGTSAPNVTKTRLEKLIIEDDATVDEIVYSGTTYTVAEWNAFVAAF